METGKDIIIYDGQCISCNSFINYIIQHDKGKFGLLTQFSDSYAGITEQYEFGFRPEETIYLISGGRIYSKSEAIRRILARSGSLNYVLSLLLVLIPEFVRDFFYSFFARHRYIAGKHQQCPIPSKQLLNRFI